MPHSLTRDVYCLDRRAQTQEELRPAIEVKYREGTAQAGQITDNEYHCTWNAQDVQAQPREQLKSLIRHLTAL